MDELEEKINSLFEVLLNETKNSIDFTYYNYSNRDFRESDNLFAKVNQLSNLGIRFN